MDKAYIILEGYCIYKTERKIPKSKKPLWCRSKNKKITPQYKCLRSNCPFFAYTDASEKDYKLFNKEVER